MKGTTCMIKKKFDITGMTCAACSAHVEKALKKTDGVTGAEVSLMTNCAVVTYDEKLVDDDSIIKAVERANARQSKIANSLFILLTPLV